MKNETKYIFGYEKVDDDTYMRCRYNIFDGKRSILLFLTKEEYFKTTEGKADLIKKRIESSDTN